jgi:hypothetical protein
MNNMVGLNDKNYWDHADLAIFLTDLTYLKEEALERYGMFFNKVMIAAPGERPEDLNANIEWFSYEEDQYRSEIWNTLVAKADSEWLIFIEDEEKLKLDEVPDLKDLSKNIWAPTLLIQQKEDKQVQFYQLRMVNTQWEGETLFTGLNLPDCTKFFVDHEIALTEKALVVERESYPFGHVDTEEELSIKDFSPQLYLVEGDRLFKEHKYVFAAAQYRQILKKERLIPFDRLAAVNGLASCLAEQYKWDKAVSLAEKSIEAEPFQGLPYLIKFKISQLNKQWEQALDALTKYYEHRYYERMNLYSKASFDVSLNLEGVLVTLADLCRKAGQKEQASDYLEELFSLKNGEMDSSFIHQLLVLSIELSDYQKSVFFFQKLYGDHIPLTINEKQRTELNDYMDMFMKKEWYGFVRDVYDDLHHAYPQDDEYRRRLIVTLIKTDNVEQARILATKVA